VKRSVTNSEFKSRWVPQTGVLLTRFDMEQAAATHSRFRLECESSFRMQRGRRSERLVFSLYFVYICLPD